MSRSGVSSTSSRMRRLENTDYDTHWEPDTERRRAKARGVQFRRSESARRFVRLVIGFACSSIILKAMIFVFEGQARYDGRIERLSKGTQTEVVIARAMQIDPLTAGVIAMADPLFDRVTDDWRALRRVLSVSG